jgi:hypothetical protein
MTLRQREDNVNKLRKKKVRRNRMIMSARETENGEKI